MYPPYWAASGCKRCHEGSDDPFLAAAAQSGLWKDATSEQRSNNTRISVYIDVPESLGKCSLSLLVPFTPR